MSKSVLLLIVCGVAVLLLPVILNWDKSKRSFVLAVRSLWLHKLRAMLSVTGIIIGTAAVISLMAFGEGSTLVDGRHVSIASDDTVAVKPDRRPWAWLKRLRILQRRRVGSI